MAYTQTDIIKTWLEGVRVDIVKEYDRLGLRASGNFEKSLQPFNTVTRAILYGARYAFQMQNGRLPGTYPPRKAIEDWIDAKGLKYDIPKSQLAFLIQRKIFREGIKVPNRYNAGGVISNVVTQERLQQLIDQLRVVSVLQISSEIIEIIKAA